MDFVLCCQNHTSPQKAAGQTSDQRDQRKAESLACLSLFMSHISHGALYNNSSFLSSFFFLPRFRSLWATCMTVTMTAAGAQLLLLALCVCRGSAMQQSAPRVRLSFKGELTRINQNSSDSRNCHPSDFWLVFPTRTHQLMLPCFLFIHL